jgi:hypothetical protein
MQGAEDSSKWMDMTVDMKPGEELELTFDKLVYGCNRGCLSY